METGSKQSHVLTSRSTQETHRPTAWPLSTCLLEGRGLFYGFYCCKLAMLLVRAFLGVDLEFIRCDCLALRTSWIVLDPFGLFGLDLGIEMRTLPRSHNDAVVASSLLLLLLLLFKRRKTYRFGTRRRGCCCGRRADCRAD